MAQTYQISYDARTETIAAFDILSAVAQNAAPKGLSITGLQYVAAQGRIRVTLSDAFPQSEVDSFAGTIVPL